MASKKKAVRRPKRAQLTTDISESDFLELEKAGFLPVLRWVKFGKSKLFRTYEALQKART